MGVFKLTFLTAGTIGVAMMHFGRDEGLPADRLGLEPQIEAATIVPVSASLQEDVLMAPAPAVMVTKASLTQTSVAQPAVAQPAVARTTGTQAKVTQARVTQAAYRTTPKITPPDPDSPAGRAVAAAMDMAKSADTAPAALPATSQGGFDTKYVTASAVNLRAGPSIRHGKLGRVTRGMAVLDMGPAGPGWSQVKVVDTGQRAFMASKFLSAAR